MNVGQILVPIDGSELSLAAADAAVELAQCLGASVTLLAVVEPPEAISDYVSKTALEEVRRGLWQASEAMLSAAAARLRRRQPGVETRVVWGSPGIDIPVEAAGGYQLIVMGSRGLGLPRAERDFLGSVAERVLRRAPCPVLIIPAPPKG
jgi:nucleotide-binding universal stress UspA family protein